MTGADADDLLIIGGGIHGTGIARDAAGRGLSVTLCEAGDLGRATSSASTKLIHGGLRYLEHYAFRLVREALVEREVLLRTAPHIVRPLSFVLPHAPTFRPAWMVRLGLFVYDHLGGRERLEGSRTVRLADHPAGELLSPDYAKAYVYSDCQVDDARLVVLNAMDAAERGARILPRTTCLSAVREGGLWRARLSGPDGGSQWVRARALVNAAGPWAAQVLEKVLSRPSAWPVRLVKGSHFVIPRLYEGDFACIFQNDDGRVVFTIPYHDSHTLIGTTEEDFTGDPGSAAITESEIDYLAHAVGRYFRVPVDRGKIVWSFAGVRPLLGPATQSSSALSREYVLALDRPRGTAPLLSVLGGKLTTYRRLAEKALAKLRPALGFKGGNWTAGQPLPGGDLPAGDPTAFARALEQRHPWLPPGLAQRYAHAYGTRATAIIGGAGRLSELGDDFGAGLYEAELRHLALAEWASSAEDVLWRRTKLGLAMDEAGTRRIERWFSARQPVPSAPENR